MLKIFLKEIRIHHWVKNLLVFAPLFFVGQFFVVERLMLVGLLFVAFCLSASAIYVFNDILDKESDAKHPKKKNRPIASGAMSVSTGFVIIAVFLIAACLVAIEFNTKANILLAAYIVINLGYSTILKHVPLLDIFLVAALYLIRIKAGGELINVEVSEWLILVTLFLSLFLVIGKRRAEFAHKKHDETRRVLKEYTIEFLDYALVAVVAGVMLTYSLYAISAQIPYLMYSSFFVFFGMFRYLFVIYTLGGGEAPEKVFYKDPWTLATVLMWGFYIFFVFYNAQLF